MESEQTKFWGILIMVAVGVAAAVLLIDLTIKAAILEESNALKKRINEVKWNGSLEQRSSGADSNGANNHSGNDAGDGSSNVSPFPPRMETPNVRSRGARKTSPGPMSGSIEYSERIGDGSVATDSEPVDS